MRHLLLVFCLAAVIQPNLVAQQSTAMAVDAVNEFAVAHHRLMPDGNVLASPWSIQNTLAMLAAGAVGSTRTAIEKAFFLGDDENARNASFHELQRALTAKLDADVPMEIRSSNRLFVENRLQLVPHWQKLMRESFQAEAGRASFAADADGERGKINEWVKEQTQGKIPEIIPAGALNGQTLMVLVNALYFDMPWDEQFTKELTTQQPFYLDASHAKTIPLMFKQHAQRYARKEGFQIATLPYASGLFQFVVFVPDAVDGLAAVEKQLTGALLSECARFPRTEVRLSIPRLAMSAPVVSLKQTLTAMGAGEMFADGKADFSRMIFDAERLQPYVSDVYHRTFIEMDEDGTKAASASAGVVRYKNGAPKAIAHQVVKADRPFLFMIQHVSTGACLFLGRVSDPAPLVAATTAPPPVHGPAKK